LPLFPPSFLARLEYLALVSRQVFNGQLMAAKRSRRLGSGIEFADHRPYVPGDDFRYLNWNAYAHHDELLLRRFHEEQDLHVQIIVDCSASMSPSKLTLACQIAAALAYIALNDLDRVAIHAVSDQVVSQVPMTRGKAQTLPILRFFEQLLQKPASTQTNLAKAIDTIVQRASHPGPAILISDLLDPHGFQGAINRLRYHKHEPHIIQIFDPSEADPTLLGDVELVDAESGETRKVTLTESSLTEYKKQYAAFIDSLQHYCRTYSLGLTQASTAIPFDQIILRMMRQTGVVQ
jgi:uncharacterized protein (DUF58 family)